MIDSAVKNILVVDDEQEVLDVMSEMLGSLGYLSTGVKQGREALKLAKTKRFDLVITDLRMPEMGGLAFAKKFRRQQKEIPIIVTAGVNLNKSKIDLEKYGVNDFIRKPFFIEEIHAKLRTLLHESQAAQKSANEPIT
jgi:CheY-like chemotaxis protein